MDIRLQELLDRIKKEGLEEAKAASEAIVAEAEGRRKAIVAQAEQEAKLILEKAKADAQRFQDASVAAIGQASRNLTLAFKDEIEKLLAAITKRETEKAFDDSVLKNALPAVLAAWKEKGADDLAVLLPQAELKKLEGYFSDKLASELKRGLVLKPSPALKSGFRVAERNGAAYYDFSAEAVAELMGQYLNIRLASIMNDAAKGL